MTEAAAHREGRSGPSPDLTGATVGRFAIRARLGAGGMGEVYLAEDTKLKRPVAIKRVTPYPKNDEQHRQRFLREAEFASRLNDPHIANIYDVFEEGGDTFLVMEYVEGESLRQRLTRRAPMLTREFVPLAVQCAKALEAAHGRGILHRDIKPENIMLTPSGQAKVLDFGVAKLLSRENEGTTLESSAGGLSGTPAYMAPEVLLEKEPDARSDIFSLGVVFYEALTGRHPFWADSFLATSNRIVHEAPVPMRVINPRVPEELERVVAKMLAKDRAERYATAADLTVDLRALERRGEARRQVTFAPGIHMYLRVALALLLAVVLVVAGIALLRLFRPKPIMTQRIRVAVLPFLNQTGDQRLDRYRLALTQVLVLDLTGSPNIQVLSYERLLEITRGFEAEGRDFSSPEAAKAVASYGNSQFVVLPAMFAIGKTLRVSAEFRDAQTGQAVGATKVERALSGPAEDTLYSMLGQLEDGIQAYFKNVGRGIAYPSLPEGSRPKTATAALNVNEGRYAFARGNYAQALNSFQQAIEEDPEFALPYAWTGQIYGFLGYDDKAREFSKKAARLIRPETPVTEAYFIEANLHERKYDFSAAAEKYLELIRLYPDDPEWQARLAEVYKRQGQYSRAIASYQEALRADANYIVAYEELGSLYSWTSDLSQAISYAQKGLDLYRVLRNREGQVSALVVLGEALRLKGDHQRARESAQSALALSKASADEFGALQATKLLGDIGFTEGDYKQARQHYQHVLSASTGIHNNRLVVLTLMNTGVTYHRDGNLAKAADYYQRSLAQEKLYGEYKDWPSLRGRALALSNLGSMFIEYGPEPDRGLQFVQDSLTIFQMMKNTWWTAHGEGLLGLYYANAGQYEQAMDHLLQAQALYRSIDDKDGLALVTHKIGRCYFLQNRYERALESFAGTLKIYRDAQDSFGVANAQIHLGWTYDRLGDTAQARALLAEALQSVEKNGHGELLPDAYNALGELYRGAGEAERARSSFERASALWKEPHVSEFSIEARSSAGLLDAEAGNSERGLVHCREAFGQVRQLGRVHTLARTATNLARVFLLRREYEKAVETLEEIAPLEKAKLGLELRGQALYYRAKALEGLGKTREAKASYSEAQTAIRKLEHTLPAADQKRFAARPEIRIILR